MLSDGGADHLKPGMALPSVSLPATDGTAVDLAVVPRRSVVMIYPWTGRPGQPNPPNWDDISGAHGSTPELEGFRDHHAEFAQRGLRLFGLSRQASDYQRELVDRLALPFLILSDADSRFSEALHLPTFTTSGTIYLKRLTLLIEEGRIEHVFYPVSDPASHARDVLLKLQTKA